MVEIDRRPCLIVASFFVACLVSPSGLCAVVAKFRVHGSTEGSGSIDISTSSLLAYRSVYISVLSLDRDRIVYHVKHATYVTYYSIQYTLPI